LILDKTRKNKAIAERESIFPITATMFNQLNENLI